MSTKFEKISEFIDSLENDSTLNDEQAYLLVSGYGAVRSILPVIMVVLILLIVEE